jgi:hypothetical protein
MGSWISAFEAELKRRGLAFDIEPESGRHRVSTPFGSSLVSLDNLVRDLNADKDVGRISRFVDTILATDPGRMESIADERLYWCLEPGDHVEKAEIRAALSDRVDRVLVHLSSDGTRISWVTRGMLSAAGIAEAEAALVGFQNLSRELAASRIEYFEIGEVRLGFINSTLAFKSSLMLAPNLREIVEPVLGWPVLAVAPDRGFLYLWAEKHKDFVGRVGRTVVKEHFKAAYPISTEVYSITDEGLEAIGEFPKSG